MILNTVDTTYKMCYYVNDIYTGRQVMEKAVERTKALLSNCCCDELKAQGVANCDCPACTAASAVLELKDEILRNI